MCSQANLHQLLSEVLAHAQDCFGSNLDGVILYGSHARGDADEESDVDIMILVRQPAEQNEKSSRRPQNGKKKYSRRAVPAQRGKIEDRKINKHK